MANQGAERPVPMQFSVTGRGASDTQVRVFCGAFTCKDHGTFQNIRREGVAANVNCVVVEGQASVYSCRSNQGVIEINQIDNLTGECSGYVQEGSIKPQ